MTQKIIKIGTSVGVTIPKSIVKEFGFRHGQEVEVTTNPEMRSIAFRAVVNKRVAHSSLIEWTDTFVARNRELLERLKEQ